MITTKTGDKGETSLLGGRRVAKDSNEIEFFGALDELIAMLAYCSHVFKRDDLESIEKELQIVFGKIASFEKDISDDFYKRLEEKISKKEEELPEIKGFVMPYGETALLHMLRALARKVERRFVSASKARFPNALKYFNRLSDYLFLVAYEEALKRDELKYF